MVIDRGFPFILILNLDFRRSHLTVIRPDEFTVRGFCLGDFGLLILVKILASGESRFKAAIFLAYSTAFGRTFSLFSQ